MEESPLARKNWVTASTEKLTDRPMRVRKDFKAISQASSCGTSASSSTSFSPVSAAWEGGVLLLVLFPVRVQRLEGLCLPLVPRGSMPSPSPPPPPGPLASVPGSVPRAWNRKRQAVNGQIVRQELLSDSDSGHHRPVAFGSGFRTSSSCRFRIHHIRVHSRSGIFRCRHSSSSSEDGCTRHES
jgi:hypothetical protein